MGDKSKIEWCDASWNPVRGCTRVSEGCRNCYAERVAARFSGPGLPYEGLAKMTPSGPRWTGAVRLVPEHLQDPLRWKKPRRIFVNSMSDLFHESLSLNDIEKVWRVMCTGIRQGHVFQVLTKRAERMREAVPALMYRIFGPHWAMPAGIHLGVSVEDQDAADERIPHLVQTPAAVRFLSCEPLLGPLDLTRIRMPLDGESFWTRSALHATDGLNKGKETAGRDQRVDWVIAGGESGPGARPCHPGWARELRDQCQAAGVRFFWKQWGDWKPISEMTEEESDALYLPPPARDPEGIQECKVETCTLDFHGGDTYQLLDGHCGYLMFRVGKHRAGRLLDGRTWDEFPEVARG